MATGQERVAAFRRAGFDCEIAVEFERPESRGYKRAFAVLEEQGNAIAADLDTLARIREAAAPFRHLTDERNKYVPGAERRLCISDYHGITLAQAFALLDAIDGKTEP